MQASSLATVVFATALSWAVFLLLAALVLKLSVQLAANLRAGYWRLVAVLAVTSVLMLFVQWATGAALGLGPETMQQVRTAEVAAVPTLARAVLGTGIVLTAAWLLLALGLDLAVRRPDGSRMGYGRALLAALLAMVLLVVVGIAIGVVLGLLGLGSLVVPAA
ncbi:hypothetical protein [Arenimonas sp.]|uniref:hypothetical protein n=1 Tax=Arenimonas sp. TaxID=1872635 RepID=UPI0035B28309